MAFTETKYEVISCKEPGCNNTFRWSPRFSSIKPKRCQYCENKHRLEKQKEYAEKSRKRQKEKLAHLSTGRISPAKKGMKTKRNHWYDKATNRLIHHVQFHIVNPYIRARDTALFKGKCISCDNEPISGAGHRFSVGDYPGMRFLISNIHGQGTDCNQFQDGNVRAFDEGLKARFGEKFVQKLHATANAYQHGHFKLLRHEIIEIGHTYKYLHENKIWIFSETQFENYLNIINGNI